MKYYVHKLKGKEVYEYTEIRQIGEPEGGYEARTTVVKFATAGPQVKQYEPCCGGRWDSWAESVAALLTGEGGRRAVVLKYQNVNFNKLPQQPISAIKSQQRQY